MMPSQKDGVSTSPKSLVEVREEALTVDKPIKRKWYRTTFFNMTILGLCNFAAPGLWIAMNSLGAGGAATPRTVNAANALVYGLMALVCIISPAFVNQFGVKATLIFGTCGYSLYSAGLYTNSKDQTTWLLFFGAATCGICAGLFWMIEGAIAISYPEPDRRGKALAYWLCYRVAGQIVGGSINLGINANHSQAGGIDRRVYIVFIALQACGPFIGAFLSRPENVQRRDGSKVELYVGTSLGYELRALARLFFSKKFLFLAPLIAQAVFNQAFTGTYFTKYFTVRVRALGSFTSAILCMIGGLVGGYILDHKGWPLKYRIRIMFFLAVGGQGGVWIYSQIIQGVFARDKPVIDWVSPDFAKGFILYLLLQLWYQLQYLFMFHVTSMLVRHPRDVIRVAALLRGTESAAQSVGFGINASAFSLVGTSAINLGLWAVALFPAWLIVRKVGVVDLAENLDPDEQDEKDGIVDMETETPRHE